MERTDDLDAGLDFAGRLESAKAFIAGRYDLGKVLVQAQGSDFLEEGAEGCSSDSGP